MSERMFSRLSVPLIGIGAVALILTSVLVGPARALPNLREALDKVFGTHPEETNAPPSDGTVRPMPNEVTTRARSVLPASPGARVASEVDPSFAVPTTVGGGPVPTTVRSADDQATAELASETAATEFMANTGVEGDSVMTEGGLLDEILLSPDPYYYESLGRRDPFVSLVAGEGDDDTDDEDRERPENLIVVGILWGDGDRYALVETMEGRSLVMREGGRYGTATVTRINPDGIVLYVNDYGVGRTVQLQVSEGRKGSKKNDRDR